MPAQLAWRRYRSVWLRGSLRKICHFSHTPRSCAERLRSGALSSVAWNTLFDISLSFMLRNGLPASWRRCGFAFVLMALSLILDVTTASNCSILLCPTHSPVQRVCYVPSLAKVSTAYSRILSPQAMSSIIKTWFTLSGHLRSSSTRLPRHPCLSGGQNGRTCPAPCHAIPAEQS